MVEPIVLYDGLCPLCNGIIRIIIRFDHQKQFYFAALQSEIGRNILSYHKNLSAIDSIVLVQHNQTSIKSKAVFEICSLLGFPFNLLLIGKIIPQKYNDFLYDFIARNRTKLGRKYTTCKLPPVKWRSRFLN